MPKKAIEYKDREKSRIFNPPNLVEKKVPGIAKIIARILITVCKEPT